MARSCDLPYRAAKSSGAGMCNVSDGQQPQAMMAILLAAAACVAVDGERILARDLVPAGEAFAALTPDLDTEYTVSPFASVFEAQMSATAGAGPEGVGVAD